MCDISRPDSSRCPSKSGKLARHLRVTGSLPFHNDHTSTAPPARRSARQAKSSLEETLRSKKYFFRTNTSAKPDPCGDD
jgi:hypothetical protein